MRLLTSAVWTTIATGLVTGCSGNIAGPSGAATAGGGGIAPYVAHLPVAPVWSELATAIPDGLAPRAGESRLRLGPDFNPDKKKPKGGLYGSQFYAGVINGYPANNAGDHAPICSVAASYPNNVAVDGMGNLIDPDGGSHSIVVYRGKGMCGRKLGTISDPYGQPADAATANAATGKIAVANIFDVSGGAGSISVCTLSHGCKSNLTNSAMYKVAGVAMARNGDCWASSVNASGAATLTFFKACTGSGKVATGFANAFYGGIDIDKRGNLVTVDLGGSGTSTVNVYKGCNPKCKLVGGPFPLQGETVYGHLNKTSSSFAAADFQYGQIDVYKYAGSSLKYLYSFNKGLSVSDDVEGAAYNPPSKE
ncbi:MAG: hypothetical protein WA814_00170 [Candidatus Baltobacteraceae bacterium]